ncbi:hypothetical protein IMSAG025_01393 [Muribaculaceae bacterium]|nr:hypothetical protein IMSAG025_01393 [Muribaculaceae bacterium]
MVEIPVQSIYQYVITESVARYERDEEKREETCCHKCRGNPDESYESHQKFA